MRIWPSCPNGRGGGTCRGRFPGGRWRNRQPWRFIAVTDRTILRDLAAFVFRPANLEGCAAAIAVVLTNPRAQFDAGRSAQNMMLAAWTLGLRSRPHTPSDEGGAK